MGDITALGRYDNVAGTRTRIDTLTYTYSGYRQTRVDDSSSYAGAWGFTDTVKQASEYTYNGNGNMLKDLNKGITGISYNMLNLPQTITKSNGNSVAYVYDASGRKLRKISVDVASGNTITTEYVNGIEYDNGTAAITFIQTEEGRARKTGTAYKYEYDLKDHLGNTRLTTTWAPADSVSQLTPLNLQHTEYYAFGYTIQSLQNTVPSPKNLYLYNHKELQEETGLYDYGARFYDPVIGRWTAVDPLAEKMRRWTPYNYAINNPIRFIDPDGKEIINIEGGVRFTGADAQIAFAAVKQQASSNQPFKIHFVYESKTKGIYNLTLKAFRQGKPEVLHYDADVDRQKDRRKAALAAYPGKGDGTERDEYPYASTFEGGKGATVDYVPWKEQRSQGGSLSALYKKMTQGEAFVVIPVPKDKEPDNEEPIATISNKRNNGENVTKVGMGTVIAIGAYEVVKWGIAAFTAPETLGGSLAGAAALP
jgi:RHS repeat-associated protein